MPMTSCGTTWPIDRIRSWPPSASSWSTCAGQAKSSLPSVTSRTKSAGHLAEGARCRCASRARGTGPGGTSPNISLFVIAHREVGAEGRQDVGEAVAVVLPGERVSSPAREWNRVKSGGIASTFLRAPSLSSATYRPSRNASLSVNPRHRRGVIHHRFSESRVRPSSSTYFLPGRVLGQVLVELVDERSSRRRRRRCP